MREPQGRPIKLPPHSKLFPIGSEIKGHDCAGQPFTGTVTAPAGSYALILDGNIFTPTSLVDEVNGCAAPAGEFSKSMFDDAQPEAEATGGVFD